MGFARRTLRFSGGLLLGAAVGTAISVLLAPQSGEELKASIKDLREEAKRAGEEAELLETERLRQLYRRTVSDPLALTGKRQPPGLAAPSPEEQAAERAKKEREEADKAHRAAQKAEEQLRKAEEEARKARATAEKEAAEAVAAKAATQQTT